MQSVISSTTLGNGPLFEIDALTALSRAMEDVKSETSDQPLVAAVLNPDVNTKSMVVDSSVMDSTAVHPPGLIVPVTNGELSIVLMEPSRSRFDRSENTLVNCHQDWAGVRRSSGNIKRCLALPFERVLETQGKLLERTAESADHQTLSLRNLMDLSDGKTAGRLAIDDTACDFLRNLVERIAPSRVARKRKETTSVEGIDKIIINKRSKATVNDEPIDEHNTQTPAGSALLWVQR